MASEVDISNIALAHLGDAATVASIDPPEGSAQAEHCAIFYPIARDALLEMHDWGFATRRVALAQLTNETTAWAYCYARPNDMIRAIGVLDPTAADDSSVAVPTVTGWAGAPLTNGGIYTPREFALESRVDGAEVVYTNQADAVMRYVSRVTDTSRFPPLVVICLGHFLASLLAGPVVKGSAGAAEGARQRMMAFGQDGKSGAFGRAVGSDAGQRMSNARDRHQVAWLNAR